MVIYGVLNESSENQNQILNPNPNFLLLAKVKEVGVRVAKVVIANAIIRNIPVAVLVLDQTKETD